MNGRQSGNDDGPTDIVTPNGDNIGTLPNLRLNALESFWTGRLKQPPWNKLIRVKTTKPHPLISVRLENLLDPTRS